MNKVILVMLLTWSVSAAHTQPITIADSAHFQSFCGLPYDPSSFSYTYGQAIYYESEIQGSGYITAISFYYLGNNLSHSDSVAFYMGHTDSTYFKYLLKSVPLTKVFDSIISYSILPGVVTIQLKTPYYYNGVGNLVIAANELRAGYETTLVTFAGSYIVPPPGRGGRSSNVKYPSAINPNKLDSLPMYALPVAGGAGATPYITIYGLTPFPCQSPKRVRFGNITHNSAKVAWTMPKTGNTPSSYELYYSTAEAKPAATVTPSVTNITDTQSVLSPLSSNTTYFVWLRSRCSASETSVWTLVDSFKTLCTPVVPPTTSEPFDIFLPACWARDVGTLANPTQFRGYDAFKDQSYWQKRPYRNKTGSTNYAARAPLYSDTLRHWLISPPYNLGTGNNFSLEFDMALTGNGDTLQGSLDSDDKFMVVISTDEGLTWSNANVLRTWAYPEFIPVTGQRITIPLSAYSGIIRIGFYVQSTVMNIVSHLFIDNVKVSNALPVTLLDFTGMQQGSANLLTWRTATEQNNRGFEVQRSVNGNEFITIGFVPTQARGGNSTAVLSYKHTDKAPLAGNNYYRLKQVDYDGKNTLSNLVVIKHKADNRLQLTGIAPNPVKSKLQVNLSSPLLQKVQLTITDLTGRPIMQQAVQLQQGENLQVMNVSSLSKGVYLLKLQSSDNDKRAVKFVKE